MQIIGLIILILFGIRMFNWLFRFESNLKDDTVTVKFARNKSRSLWHNPVMDFILGREKPKEETAEELRRVVREELESIIAKEKNK